MPRRTRCRALLALAAFILLAGAEPLTAQAGPPPASGAAPKLPQSMRLDPALAANLPSRVVLPSIERLDALHATFKEKFRLTKTAFETMCRVTNECSVRAYTQQEQQEAGCRPQHSVQLCGEMLMCWCRRSASREWLSRYSELEAADRELKAEILRLVLAVQKDPLAAHQHLVCN